MLKIIFILFFMASYVHAAPFPAEGNVPDPLLYRSALMLCLL